MFHFDCRFAPGQPVLILPLGIVGWVWQVMVSSGSVCYDCYWWYGGKREASVLTELELGEAPEVGRVGYS